ncbi:TonB-dependent receptor [Andreprevotia chitinilytica]|uniref:TonB-dependent receptor n=1 Tax=Andreprevotia chitinilytica TaxID=396808 RepID=UPI0005540B50|nr:TonB-dependent siderophore receptor [Andreprevotia chitinilytica]
MKTRLHPLAQAIALGFTLFPCVVHAEDTALPEVHVTAQANGSYAEPVSSTATRIPLELKDVPQTVNVINQALLHDQNATSMQDALSNVVGIGQSVGDGQRDQITIRGFTAINDQFIDGVRDDALYFRDLSNIERVEVLKGPGSVLYGRGSAGGLINRITKKPTATPEQTVGVQLDEFGQKRAEVDVGAAGKAAQLRLTGAYERSEGFRNQSFLDREAIAPSLALQLTDRTRLLVQADYLHDRRLADQGVPGYHGWPVDVPIETYYGSADGRDDTFIDSKVTSQTATLEHDIAAETHFKQLVRHYQYDLSRNYTNIQKITDGATPTVTISQSKRLRADNGWFSQSELSHAFDTGGLRHDLLTGIELSQQTKTERLWSKSNVATYNLFNPQLKVLGPMSTTGKPSNDNVTDIDVSAAYLQDLISVGHWKILAGVRFDHIRQKRDDLTAANLDLERTDNVWSPRLGVTYEVTPAVSLYGSISRSFQPLADSYTFRSNSDELKPEQTTAYEFGTKADLFDGRASATLAVFQIDKKDMLTGDPTDATRYIPVGRQQSRGVEMSLAGQLRQGLEASIGYAYLDAIIKEASDGLAGKRPSLTPRHTANAWLKQALGGNCYATAGVRYVGERYASAGNAVRLPGYTVGDIGLIYQGKKFDANLMLKNVANVKYYVAGHSGADDYNMPGAPRTVSVSGRWHF